MYTCTGNARHRAPQPSSELSEDGVRDTIRQRHHLQPLGHVPHHRVPQGFVLGQLIFILQMYTTPLSHLIESSFVGHHLCSDEIQLFISFKFFPTSIAQLIYANLSMDVVQPFMHQAINLYNTEFTILGLPDQIKKISYHADRPIY